MTDLVLSSNLRLESISPDAFEGLSALQTLNLYQTRISTLPSGVFDGLTGLATLQISVTSNVVAEHRRVPRFGPRALFPTFQTAKSGGFIERL